MDVLVAIADPVVGIGFRAILDESGDCRCACLLGEPDRIRSEVARLEPDVAVVDVRYRRADPELVGDIVRSSPGTHVLIYVDHPAEECAMRHLLAHEGRAGLAPEALAMLDECCLTSLQGGALGCIGSGAPADAIPVAVRTVAHGQLAAGPWLAALAETWRGAHADSDIAPISARELEVMALLAKGLGNRQIGDRLGIREQTVKNHLTRIMAKMGVESRLEVGVLVARHRLVLRDDPAPSA